MDAAAGFGNTFGPLDTALRPCSLGEGGIKRMPESDDDLSFDLLSDFTDYDHALYRVLDGGVDYIAQISAIRDLLHRHKQADESIHDEMTKITEFIKKQVVREPSTSMGSIFSLKYIKTPPVVWRLSECWLRPIELMFDQSFAGIRQLFETSAIAINSSHPRWDSRPKRNGTVVSFGWQDVDEEQGPCQRHITTGGDRGTIRPYAQRSGAGIAGTFRVSEQDVSLRLRMAYRGTKTI